MTSSLDKNRLHVLMRQQEARARIEKLQEAAADPLAERQRANESRAKLANIAARRSGAVLGDALNNNKSIPTLAEKLNGQELPENFTDVGGASGIAQAAAGIPLGLVEDVTTWAGDILGTRSGGQRAKAQDYIDTFNSLEGTDIQPREFDTGNSFVDWARETARPEDRKLARPLNQIQGILDARRRRRDDLTASASAFASVQSGATNADNSLHSSIMAPLEGEIKSQNALTALDKAGTAQITAQNAAAEGDRKDALHPSTLRKSEAGADEAEFAAELAKRTLEDKVAQSRLETLTAQVDYDTKTQTYNSMPTPEQVQARFDAIGEQIATNTERTQQLIDNEQDPELARQHKLRMATLTEQTARLNAMASKFAARKSALEIEGAATDQLYSEMNLMIGVIDDTSISDGARGKLLQQFANAGAFRTLLPEGLGELGIGLKEEHGGISAPFTWTPKLGAVPPGSENSLVAPEAYSNNPTSTLSADLAEVDAVAAEIGQADAGGAGESPLMGLTLEQIQAIEDQGTPETSRLATEALRINGFRK